VATKLGVCSNNWAYAAPGPGLKRPPGAAVPGGERPVAYLRGGPRCDAPLWPDHENF